MKEVETGLDVVLSSPGTDTRSKKNVAFFCQKALMVSDYSNATENFIKFFGSQYGFATDVQHNMIVSNYIVNFHFNIPVYFLYLETHIPADDILEGIDHIFIGLQEMGCRMDPYNYTLSLLLYKCIDKNTEIIALDRPKPLNEIDIEGHILNLEFEFHIGRHSLPARHALSIGEIALLHQKKWAQGKINLTVIKMKNWERNLFFEDTGWPWILPLSNLARAKSTYTFPSTVLVERTKLSEGRGTTKAFEIIEHPKNEPYLFYKHRLKSLFKNEILSVFTWRSIIFLLTFQKYFGKVCGGFEIFVTDKTNFKPWRVAQLLIGELYPYLVNNFVGKHPTYKYNYAQNQ